MKNIIDEIRNIKQKFRVGLFIIRLHGRKRNNPKPRKIESR